MFDAVVRKTIVPLIMRLALAAIFIIHGLQKVNSQMDWGAEWYDNMFEGQMAAPKQKLIAYCELFGGIALGLGFLTRLACLGIITLMAGAIWKVTGANGFSIMNGGYEYNLILIVMSLGLFLIGGGPIGLDYLLFPRGKSQVPVATPAVPSQGQAQPVAKSRNKSGKPGVRVASPKAPPPKKRH